MLFVIKLGSSLHMLLQKRIEMFARLRVKALLVGKLERKCEREHLPGEEGSGVRLGSYDGSRSG